MLGDGLHVAAGLADLLGHGLQVLAGGGVVLAGAGLHVAAGLAVLLGDGLHVLAGG